jgi:hypothetical protein
VHGAGEFVELVHYNKDSIEVVDGERVAEQGSAGGTQQQE